MGRGGVKLSRLEKQHIAAGKASAAARKAKKSVGGTDIFIVTLMLCPQLCLFPSRFDFCNPCYNLVFVQAQMLVPNNAFA